MGLLLSAAPYILAGFLLLVWIIKRHFSYWERRGFPQLDPVPIIGNMGTKAEVPGFIYARLYNRLKERGLKYGGVYSFLRRSFMPVDHELIKRIFVKDFEYFAANQFFHHPNDILSQQLLTMSGKRWKSMRTSLTRAFSTGKIKYMFDTTMVAKSAILNITAKELAGSKDPIDARDLMARFTTDVIVSSALGLKCDSLREPDNIFRFINNDLTVVSPWMTLVKNLILEPLVPYSILGTLGYKTWGNPKMRQFFMKMVKESAEAREKDNVVRNDFFQMLLQLKNRDFDPTSTHGKAMTSLDGLTQEQLAAQSFVFFVGGYETTSTTLTFALLNMALYPEFQNKCREEVREVLSRRKGKISYEAVQEMAYLDMFIHESLRLYAPFQHWDRKCTKNYKIPGTNLVIERGTHVVIPVRGIHMDPDLFPNPEEFNPENFSKENKQRRPEQSYLAFGGGPRMCIGQRFAYVNIQCALAVIIKDLEVKLNSKTKLPIEIDPEHFVTAAKGGVWLDFVKCEE